MLHPVKTVSPFSVIDAALAVAGKVAEHANLYLRRTTELDAMLRIQNMLGASFDVVKPSRKLLKVIFKSRNVGSDETRLSSFISTFPFCFPSTTGGSHDETEPQRSSTPRPHTFQRRVAVRTSSNRRRKAPTPASPSAYAGPRLRRRRRWRRFPTRRFRICHRFTEEVLSSPRRHLRDSPSMDASARRRRQRLRAQTHDVQP